VPSVTVVLDPSSKEQRDLNGRPDTSHSMAWEKPSGPARALAAALP
jgi:hypothetical protein